MGTYKHILLAADLIENDDHPVSRKALELAKQTNAKLSIIHVVEYPHNYGLPYESPTLAEWQVDMENTAKNDLKKLADELKIPEDQRYMLSGQARLLILETAGKIQADLIILGSHGRHGLGLLLMGSTATGVLHGAQCDVLGTSE